MGTIDKNKNIVSSSISGVYIAICVWLTALALLQGIVHFILWSPISNYEYRALALILVMNMIALYIIIKENK